MFVGAVVGTTVGAGACVGGVVLGTVVGFVGEPVEPPAGAVVTVDSLVGDEVVGRGVGTRVSVVGTT